jgi:hypothetical protein
MHVDDNDNFTLLVIHSFCDKILSVGDVFVRGIVFWVKYLLRGCLGDLIVYGFFFPKIFTKGCAIFIESPNK